jgi:hypothetical protein
VFDCDGNGLGGSDALALQCAVEEVGCFEHLLELLMGRHDFLAG